jgi:signal peptidase I
MLVVARRSALVLVVLSILGAAALFLHGGYRPYAVKTGSMLPAYRPGDLVVDRPTGSYQVGDVITFRPASNPGQLVTHRIVEVDGVNFRTQGDANSTSDPWTVAESNIAGKVVRHVSKAGYVLFYLRQPAGVGSLLSVLTGLILAWSLCFPAEEVTP